MFEETTLVVPPGASGGGERDSGNGEACQAAPFGTPPGRCETHLDELTQSVGYLHWMSRARSSTEVLQQTLEQCEAAMAALDRRHDPRLDSVLLAMSTLRAEIVAALAALAAK